MSWSVSAVGEPEAVARHLSNYMSEQASNQSKDEYDAAKPHLIALVLENFATDGASEWARGYLVSIEASGSGSRVGGTGVVPGTDVSRQCSVTLKTIGRLVT